MSWQVKDKLLFNNTVYDLNVTLLETYFREINNQMPERTVVDTSCWRGHIVDFEIQNKELLIKKFIWIGDDEGLVSESIIREHFPNRKLDWFSGFIRIDNFKGDYDNESNESAIFEYLEIKHGNLMSHWILNWDEFNEFRLMLFDEFKELKEYEVLFRSIQKENHKMKSKEIDHEIFNQIIAIANDNYLKIAIK